MLISVVEIGLSFVIAAYTGNIIERGFVIMAILLVLVITMLAIFNSISKKNGANKIYN